MQNRNNRDKTNLAESLISSARNAGVVFLAGVSFTFLDLGARVVMASLDNPHLFVSREKQTESRNDNKGYSPELLSSLESRYESLQDQRIESHNDLGKFIALKFDLRKARNLLGKTGKNRNKLNIWDENINDMILEHYDNIAGYCREQGEKVAVQAKWGIEDFHTYSNDIVYTGMAEYFYNITHRRGYPHFISLYQKMVKKMMEDIRTRGLDPEEFSKEFWQYAS